MGIFLKDDDEEEDEKENEPETEKIMGRGSRRTAILDSKLRVSSSKFRRKVFSYPSTGIINC